MRADIDHEQRLRLQPESLTECTALHVWWYALSDDVRQQIEKHVVPLIFEESMRAGRLKGPQP